MKREPETVRALFDKLMQARLEVFPEFRQRLTAPTRRGVYVIYDPRGKVLHVGRTPRAQNGIAQRLRGHMAGRSSFVKEHFRGDGSKLRGRCKFRCLVVKNPRRRALLEAYAISHLCPAHLGLGLAAL